MVNAGKVVVEEFTHLSCRENPNDDQARQHRPAGKPNWCEEQQSQNVLQMDKSFINSQQTSSNPYSHRHHHEPN